MRPLYAIAARVPAGNRVRHFHSEDANGARYMIAEPPSFRHGGFDLRTLDAPHAGPDSCWEVTNGERKVIRLFQDGTLIVRLAADATFLGWSDPEEWKRYPRINPVPAVEAHAIFAHLYAGVVNRLVSQPAEVRITMVLRDAITSAGRLFLTEHYRVPLWQVSDPKMYLVHTDPAQAEIVVLPAEITRAPNRVAFKLAEAFASLFGMPPEKLPFVKDGASGKEVDVDAIKSL